MCGKCKFCFSELPEIFFPLNIFNPWLVESMDAEFLGREDWLCCLSSCKRKMNSQFLSWTTLKPVWYSFLLTSCLISILKFLLLEGLAFIKLTSLMSSVMSPCMECPCFLQDFSNTAYNTCLKHGIWMRMSS